MIETASVRSRVDCVRTGTWLNNRGAQRPPRIADRTAAFVTSFGLAACLLAAALAMESTTLTLAAAGLVALLVLLYSPALLILSFGLIAFISGWFYAAAQEGVLRSPPYIAQVWAWALILGAMILPCRGVLRAPPRIVVAVGSYVAVLIYSVLLGGFRTGSTDLLLDGGKSVVIMLSPLLIAAHLARSRSVRSGAFIVASIVIFEGVFGVVQYIGIHGGTTGLKLFTVGSSEGWWNTNALFGTFPTLGKNSFGGALAICAPLMLALALGRERSWTKTIFLTAYVIAVIDIILSVSRGAMLAVLVASIVVGMAQTRKRFIVIGALVGLGLYLLPVTNSTFAALERQGVKDADAQTRLTVWQAISDNITGLSWLGEGYGTGGNASVNLHVDLINISSRGATVVPTENMYLRQFLEGGVIAEVGLLAFLGLLIYESFARSNTVSGRTWRIGLRGVIVALIVHSLFGDVLRYGQMEGVLVLVLGCAAGALRFDRRSASVLRPVPPAEGVQLSVLPVDTEQASVQAPDSLLPSAADGQNHSFRGAGNMSEYVNREAARRAGETVGFSFGANWRKYLRVLDDERIQQAEAGLARSFGSSSLAGERFIDIGCGSGLSSLCASRIGAEEVISIDIDPNSIACTNALKRTSDRPSSWTVLRGSVLDREFLATVHPAARVYSWGVLHHSGAMWEAIGNALTLVEPGGLCCLALYNRPRAVGVQIALKRLYNRTPRLLRAPLVGAYGTALLAALLKRRRNPVRYVQQYGRRSRGMSFWRDVEDWLGGLPFEYTSPEEIRAFTAPRGFVLERVLTGSPGANNEYLLRRLG